MHLCTFVICKSEAGLGLGSSARNRQEYLDPGLAVWPWDGRWKPGDADRLPALKCRGRTAQPCHPGCCQMAGWYCCHSVITSEGTSVAHFAAHTSILPTQGFCVSIYSSRVGCFWWCTVQPQQLCETLTFPGRNSTSISSTSNYGINYKRLSSSPG